MSHILVVLVSMLLIFASCAKEPPALQGQEAWEIEEDDLFTDGIKDSALDDCCASWIGEYSYGESIQIDENPRCYFPHDVFSDTALYDCTINIYEWEGKLYAYIAATGYEFNIQNLRAEVLCLNNEIHLFFDEYMRRPSSVRVSTINGGYIKSENKPLLSFQRQDDILITVWGQLSPTLIKDEPAGVYFTFEPTVQFDVSVHDELDPDWVIPYDNEKIDCIHADGCASWIGQYGFFEYAPGVAGSPLMMGYTINIYERENRLYAYIVIDGRMTLTRVRTWILCDENEISLMFDECMYEDMDGTRYYRSGKKPLLTFQRQGDTLITVWGTIHPMLYENEPPGIYFEFERDAEFDASSVHDKIQPVIEYG